MNKHESSGYFRIAKQTQYLKRIAESLETIVAQNALIASETNTSILSVKEILSTVKIITDDYINKK